MSNNPPVTACPDGIIYTVQTGDALSVLAQRFGISAKQLISANPQLPDSNLIFPGDQICIPKPEAPSCPGGTIYQVQSGDTMFLISLRFGVNLKTLIAANPQITNPSLIFPGQFLCIPGAASSPIQTQQISGCINGFIYTIKAGDTLSAIANRFGICLDAIIAANPGIDPNNLQIGQKICIPGPTTCSGTIYTVVAGDTLSAIAARFGTTVNAIMAVNLQMCNPNVIFVGEKICIPTIAPTTTSVPPTGCPNGFIHTIVAGDTLSALANTFGICLNAILAANPGIDPNNLQIGQKICIPGPTTCSGTIYTVVAGDTLSAIAARFGTTVNAIMAANPQMCNPNVIFVGEKICIPSITPTTTAPGLCPTLAMGSTGPDVVRLQTLLLQNGFNPGPIDGIFGPMTEAAVIAFQTAKDLTVDGIVGVQTWTALGVQCITTTIPPTTPVPCINGFIYTIKAGDTLSAIANSFGICLEAILAANPSIDPNNLQIGQKICIPGPTTCTGTIYTVVAGDTLSAIAVRFGTTVNAIMAANPQMCNPNVIFVGEKICIPSITPTTIAPGLCPTLAMGSTGPDVVRLQTLLLQNGFNPGPIDGIFGPMTEAAVIAFQTAKGLTVDGIVGVQTWTALGVQCITSTMPPTTPVPCVNGFIYTIQAGDTLSAIANRFGICLDAIIAANPGINPNNLQIGQKICIPGPATCTGTIYIVVAGDTLSAIAFMFGTTVSAILAVNPQICDPDVIFVGEKICIPGITPTTTPLSTPVLCANGALILAPEGTDLETISSLLRIPLEDLVEANPQISSPEEDISNQFVCIPNTHISCPPACTNGFIILAPEGSTLNSLSSHFEVFLEDLMAANPGIDPNADVSNQLICIPTSETSTDPPETTSGPTVTINEFVKPNKNLTKGQKPKINLNFKK